MPGPYKKSSIFELLGQGIKEARAGAFKARPRPVKATESGLQKRARTVYDPVIDAMSRVDAYSRQHRPKGNTP